jgi:hypothetical protein
MAEPWQSTWASWGFGEARLVLQGLCRSFSLCVLKNVFTVASRDLLALSLQRILSFLYLLCKWNNAFIISWYDKYIHHPSILLISLDFHNHFLRQA